ncbi:MAG: hypothetical protein WCS37_19645 [Chloroflexota bacterium]|nr:hypothetical protein [Chloroflexota bacterium]
MIYMHLLVEGQTEETFVRDVLAPYLSEKGVYPSAMRATTKPVKDGPNFKGGIVSYGKVLELKPEFPTIIIHLSTIGGRLSTVYTPLSTAFIQIAALI